MGVPGGERQEQKNTFKEIIAAKFPNLMKTNLRTQEALPLDTDKEFFSEIVSHLSWWSSTRQQPRQNLVVLFPGSLTPYPTSNTRASP